MSQPYTYLARVHRDEEGRTKSLEVAYDLDMVHLEDGDEFVTVFTKVPLEFKSEVSE